MAHKFFLIYILIKKLIIKMSTLINSFVLMIVSLFVVFIGKKIINYIIEWKRSIDKVKKSWKAYLQIHVLDYQDFNYFNEINIKVSENEPIQMNIKSNTFVIPIFDNKDKSILECELSIINSTTKKSRVFKLSIYKGLTNDVNVYINNQANNFFSSEIIFYGNINEINLNNYYYNNFNLSKRLRCVILNIEQSKLIKIIKDNNIYNNELNLIIPKALSKNANHNLLINIFIGAQKSNILIFNEESQKKMIKPNTKEKSLISEFYRNIDKDKNKDDLNNLCESFSKKLLTRNNLFGSSIIDININVMYKIIFSFINQGVNYLVENKIINERDNDFICGCLVLLLYSSKSIYSLDYNLIKSLNKILKEMKKNKFNFIDQIKAVVTFVSFNIYDLTLYSLKFAKNLKDDSPYKRAFDFYKNIINDLNEESELMLLFLQLNSGSGEEILNNKSCYKLSMISINEIKEHLINNIPRFFFSYNKKNEKDIAISDPKTQILGFNEKELFVKTGKKLTTDEENREIMNVVMCLFHEGGHQKFHMNIKEKSKNEPLLFITKEYTLQSQKEIKIGNSNDSCQYGESGLCVDYYLYFFSLYPAQILSKSSQSHLLLKKEYFTGNLDALHQISLAIIGDYLKKNHIYPFNQAGTNDIDTLKNIIKILNKKDIDEIDDDYAVINI